MSGTGSQQVRYGARLFSALCMLLGLSLIGAAAAGAPEPRAQPAAVEYQRARFEQMSGVDTGTEHEPAHAAAIPTATEMPTQTPTHAVLRDEQRDTTPPPASRPEVRFAPPPRMEIATPESTPEPALVDMPPATHIAIPAVDIDSEVVEVLPTTTTVDGQLVLTWLVADWAAGHHATSADPGEGGNIVIAGHDDGGGEVFRGLHDIEIGDEVHLSSPAGDFIYVVAEAHLRRERDAPLHERLATGVFMAPMPEERLTLITCWPYGINDHRLIVVAKPVKPSPVPSEKGI